MTDDGSAPTIPDTHRPTPMPSTRTATAIDRRYELRTLLGRGGMGEVWLAHDAHVDRQIAIKVMREGADDATGVARFLREARVQGRLEHPCVVPVHDIGGDGSAPYFAMKRLAGTTLADVLADNDQEKWPRRTLLARFVDICLAVEFAHQRGVIHRDLKPANIMLGDFGEAYVLDWGLARIRGDVETPVPVPVDASAPGQTAVGAMLGTPGYMSPEQMRGEAIDHRTDVYALGCILFEILTGTPANARTNAIEDTLFTQAHRPSRARTWRRAPAARPARAATASEPPDRLESARVLADRVQKFLAGDRDIARRRELAATHVEQAKTSFALGDAGRADAMHEAGSALALDAQNRDAQALLARLLLEPPREVPAAAQDKIDRDRKTEARTMLRWIFSNYGLFLIATIALYLLGVSRSWPIVLIGIELLALTALCLAALRRESWISPPFAIVLILLHCAMMGTVCVLMGPVLLGPSLIFGSATVMLAGPILRVPKLTVILHLLIIAVPLALELAGILPRTFSFDASGSLVFKPWALEISPVGLVAVLLGQSALQLLGNAFVLDSQRLLQDTAQRQLHVQAWQLQQLVPTTSQGA